MSRLQGNPELATLCSELRGVDWVQLGLQLRVPPWRIQTIRQQHPRNEARCLMEMLDWWMKQDTDVTWEGIAVALRSIEETPRAEAIIRRHLPRQERVLIGSDLRSSLIELRRHFSEMMVSLRDSLRGYLYNFPYKRSRLGRFKVFAANTLNESDFILCRRFDSIFLELMKHTNLFQIDALKLIIHGFFRHQPRSRCRQCIAVYEEHLQRFQRSTMVKHLKDEIHMVLPPSDDLEPGYSALVLVLHDEWLEHTKKDLDDLIYHVFRVSKGVLLMKKITLGSVEVHFVFKSYLKKVLADFVDSNDTLLKEVGIKKVIIGKDQVIYSSSEEPIPSGPTSIEEFEPVEISLRAFYVDSSKTERGHQQDSDDEKAETISIQSVLSIQSTLSKDIDIWEAISQKSTSLVRRALPYLTQEDLQKVDDIGRNLLHAVVASGTVELIMLILSAFGIKGELLDKMKWAEDKNGVTPLLLALESQNTEIFGLLFDPPMERESPPPVSPLRRSQLNINQDFSVLLQASLHNNLQVAGQILGRSFGNPVILCEGFNSHFDIEFSATLLEHTIPLVVVGDSGVGKSSLIKSLHVEGALPWLKHFLFAVPGADTHKAGIIPTHFDSIWFGKVVFFDLSSHREFVHEAILNFGSLVDAVYLIVVNLTDSIEKISQQIVYWLDFVHYHHSKLTSQSLPNVIVVGSHLHDIKLGRPLANRERFRDYAYPRAMSNVNERHFNIVSKAMMDCRKTSPENALLRYDLKGIFNHIRQARQPLPSKCYILYAIIKAEQPRTSFEDFSPEAIFGAITVGHLVQELKSQKPHCKLFDGTTQEVLKLCKPLVQLNLLLLLRDDDVTEEETWIVPDSRPFLSEIEKAIFHSPPNEDELQDVWQKFKQFPYNKGGILNHRDIVELFSKLPRAYNINLLIQLMTHYKYCEVIEKVYFFPHLLKPTLDIPPWEREEGRFMFAWTLAPESHYHYFMPHLIHHFLLRLSQAEELGVQNLERATRTLAWGDTSGVEVVVHIHSSQRLLVSMRSTPNQQLKCLKLRKAFLRKAIEIMKLLESNKDIKIVKSLIPFQTTGRKSILPFTKDGPSDKNKIRLYDTDTIKKIIINRESISVRPSNYALPLVSIDELLFFEPYYHLDHHLRERLYQSSNEVVTEEDYHDMGMALGLEMLFLLLNILEIDHTILIETPLQGVIQGSYIQLMGQKRLTYRELRNTLDSVSFFELEELVNGM